MRAPSGPEEVIASRPRGGGELPPAETNPLHCFLASTLCSAGASRRFSSTSGFSATPSGRHPASCSTKPLGFGAGRAARELRFVPVPGARNPVESGAALWVRGFVCSCVAGYYRAWDRPVPRDTCPSVRKRRGVPFLNALGALTGGSSVPGCEPVTCRSLVRAKPQRHAVPRRFLLHRGDARDVRALTGTKLAARGEQQGGRSGEPGPRDPGLNRFRRQTLPAGPAPQPPAAPPPAQ